MPTHKYFRKYPQGFTLAELLISLAILGIIATFAIPKILQTQQDTTFKSIAKEAAGNISSAFLAYQLNTPITASTGSDNLTPYFNYVKVESIATIDSFYGSGTLNCSTHVCLKLHNGAVLYSGGVTFNGTAPTNGVYYYLDPDGKVTDGTTNGPGKSLGFFLYANGHITSLNYMLPNTTDNWGVEAPCPTCDPPWFSWN